MAGKSLPVVAAALALLALLAGGGGYGFWRYNQGQYYVGVGQSGYVTIFRGTDQALAGISLSSLAQRSNLKAGELRGLGVTSFFIMQGDSPMKWAISLGVFKTESGAQALLAQLNKQGVHSARITPRGPSVPRYSYRFRDIEAAARARIESVADAVSSAETANCR